MPPAASPIKERLGVRFHPKIQPSEGSPDRVQKAWVEVALEAGEKLFLEHRRRTVSRRRRLGSCRLLWGPMGWGWGYETGVTAQTAAVCEVQKKAGFRVCWVSCTMNIGYKELESACYAQHLQHRRGTLKLGFFCVTAGSTVMWSSH